MRRKTPSGGSKADKLIRDALMIALHRESDRDDGRRTKKLQELAEKWVDVALTGDVQAMIAIADRVDGKPVQQMQHTGADDGPMAVSVDRPPRETYEEWVARRAVEVATIAAATATEQRGVEPAAGSAGGRYHR